MNPSHIPPPQKKYILKELEKGKFEQALLHSQFFKLFGHISSFYSICRRFVNYYSKEISNSWKYSNDLFTNICKYYRERYSAVILRD